MPSKKKFLKKGYSTYSLNCRMLTVASLCVERLLINILCHGYVVVDT